MITRSISLIATVLLAALFAATPVFAAVLTVGPDGDFETIQEALGEAEEGDEIVILDGDYSENIVISVPNITLRSANEHKATLIGSIRLEADGVTIDSFVIQPDSADFIPQGQGIFTPGEDGETIVRANIINTKIVTEDNLFTAEGIVLDVGENGIVTVDGSLDLGGILIAGGIGVYAEDGLNADLRADVTVGGVTATGIILEAEDDATVTITGNVTVEGDPDAILPTASATGINISTGSGLDAVIEGDVTVKNTLFGNGVVVDASGGSLLVEGDIIIDTVGEYLGSQDTALTILTFDDDENDSSFHATVNGNIEVASVNDAFGIWFSGGDHRTLTVNGDVSVKATSEGLDEYEYPIVAFAEGISMSAGNQAEALIAGDVTVSVASGSATGVSISAEDESLASISGDVTVDATYEAIGVRISIEDEGLALITGDVTVDATHEAIGVELWGGSESDFTIEGDVRVTVTIDEDEHRGYADGVSAEVGDQSSLTVTGDVNVSFIDSTESLWFGDAYGVTFVGRDESSLTVEGDVTVSDSYFATGVGFYAYYWDEDLGEVEEYYSGSATIDGNVTVTAIQQARGVEADVGANSSLTVTGDVSAKAYRVDGVEVFGEEEFELFVVGAVHAEGEASAYGVWVSSGDGAEVRVEGGVTATATNRASGISLHSFTDSEEAGEKASFLSVAGPVTVTLNETEEDCDLSCPSRSAVGIDVESNHHVTLEVSSDIQVSGGPNAEVRGINAEATSLEIENYGTIVLTSEEAADAVGVMFTAEDDESSSVFVNQGQILVEHGVAFDGRSSVGHIDFLNTGVIVGDVLLGWGDDTATLDYAGDVDGWVDGGPGNDLLILAGPKLSDLPASSKAKEIALVEFEQGEVSGGAWTFKDGTNLLNLDIQDGAVYIDGAASIGLTTLSSGLLGGSGTLSGVEDDEIAVVINEGGILAPGNSFGVLTIAGDYTQEEDGVLEIEISSGAGGQVVAGEHYDQLNILGTGVFKDGTTIRVIAAPGAYRGTAEYKIVDGDDLVFDLDKLNLEFQNTLFSRGHFEEGSITFILETDYVTAAATPNQANVAEALDALADVTGDDVVDQLFAALQGLDVGDEDKAQAAFDSLTGEVYTQVPSLIAGSIRGIAEAVNASKEAPRGDDASKTRATWVNVLGNRSQIAGGDGKAAASTNSFGLAGGTEIYQTPSGEIGLFAAYDSSALEMDARSSSLAGTGYRFGAYGRTSVGNIHLSALAAYGQTNVGSDRNIGVGSGQAKARGDFTVTDLAAAVQASFAPLNLGAWQIRPAASAVIYRGNQAAFKETGAGGAGLSVAEQAFEGASGRFGVELRRAPSPQDAGTFDLRIAAAWVNDFMVPERAIDARFVGTAATPFNVEGAAPATSGFEVTAGAAIQLSPTAALRVDFTHESRGESFDQRLRAEVSMRF